MGMLNTQEVTAKFFREVSSISTLNGANYLTSTGRIWQGGVRPSGKENPLLTIKGSRTIVNESRLEEWDLDITASADRLNNNTSDSARLANITGEIINRLDASTITLTNGKLMQTFLQLDTGILTDAARVKETSQMLRFRLMCIKSP